MKLLTQEVIKQLPQLYSTENIPDPTVQVKFFTPDSSWTWYIIEGSEQENGDWLFFTYVVGLESEYGYVLLSELETARGPLGLKIERDLYFNPTPMSKITNKKRVA